MKDFLSFDSKYHYAIGFYKICHLDPTLPGGTNKPTRLLLLPLCEKKLH